MKPNVKFNLKFGKTTLVQTLFPDYVYLNMENPETRTRFHDDPKSLLHNGRERIILTGSNPPQLGGVRVVPFTRTAELLFGEEDAD